MSMFITLVLVFVIVMWAALLAIVQPKGGPLIWITGLGAAIIGPFFPMFLLGQI